MVQRYDPSILMYKADDGDYVEYADYEKLVKVINETNQCFKCKYGYRQTGLTCPSEADADWSYLPEHRLDVEPVCQKCHKKIHRRRKAI